MTVVPRMGFIPTAAPSNRQDAMASASVVAGFRQGPDRPLLGLPRAGAVVAVCLCSCLGLMSCTATQSRSPSPPVSSVAPYAALLAVAPFTNESGVPIAQEDVFRVSDGVVSSVNEVKGWSAVPLNRTIQAMEQQGITSIPDLKTAARLVNAMGVDAIVLGTITAWDPYDPPRFGANVILLANDGIDRQNVDPRALTGQTGDEASPEPIARQMAQVVGDYDAAQHATLLRLKAYAAGRFDLEGGFDPPERYYLMVFRRYVEFGTWCLVDQLLAEERWRLNRVARH